MKRDAKVKAVFFLEKRQQKKDSFQSGVSIHFGVMNRRYSFSWEFFEEIYYVFLYLRQTKVLTYIQNITDMLWGNVLGCIESGALEEDSNINKVKNFDIQTVMHLQCSVTTVLKGGHQNLRLGWIS